MSYFFDSLDEESCLDSYVDPFSARFSEFQARNPPMTNTSTSQCFFALSYRNGQYMARNFIEFCIASILLPSSDRHSPVESYISLQRKVTLLSASFERHISRLETHEVQLQKVVKHAKNTSFSSVFLQTRESKNLFANGKKYASRASLPIKPL